MTHKQNFHRKLYLLKKQLQRVNWRNVTFESIEESPILSNQQQLLQTISQDELLQPQDKISLIQELLINSYYLHNNHLYPLILNLPTNLVCQLCDAMDTNTISGVFENSKNFVIQNASDNLIIYFLNHLSQQSILELLAEYPQCLINLGHSKTIQAILHNYPQQALRYITDKTLRNLAIGDQPNKHNLLYLLMPSLLKSNPSRIFNCNYYGNNLLMLAATSTQHTSKTIVLTEIIESLQSTGCGYATQLAQTNNRNQNFINIYLNQTNHSNSRSIIASQLKQFQNLLNTLNQDLAFKLITHQPNQDTSALHKLNQLTNKLPATLDNLKPLLTTIAIIKGSDKNLYANYLSTNYSTIKQLLLTTKHAPIIDTLFCWDGHDQLDNIEFDTTCLHAANHLFNADNDNNTDPTSEPLLYKLLPRINATLLYEITEQFCHQNPSILYEFINGYQGIDILAEQGRLNLFPQLLDLCFLNECYLPGLIAYYETKNTNLLKLVYQNDSACFGYIVLNIWPNIIAENQIRLLQAGSQMPSKPDNNVVNHLLAQSASNETKIEDDIYLETLNQLLPRNKPIANLNLLSNWFKDPHQANKTHDTTIFEHFILPYLLNNDQPISIDQINDATRHYLLSQRCRKALQNTLKKMPRTLDRLTPHQAYYISSVRTLLRDNDSHILLNYLNNPPRQLLDLVQKIEQIQFKTFRYQLNSRSKNLTAMSIHFDSHKDITNKLINAYVELFKTISESNISLDDQYQCYKRLLFDTYIPSTDQHLLKYLPAERLTYDIFSQMNADSLYALWHYHQDFMLQDYKWLLANTLPISIIDECAQNIKVLKNILDLEYEHHHTHNVIYYHHLFSNTLIQTLTASDHISSLRQNLDNQLLISLIDRYPNSQLLSHILTNLLNEDPYHLLNCDNAGNCIMNQLAKIPNSLTSSTIFQNIIVELPGELLDIYHSNQTSQLLDLLQHKNQDNDEPAIHTLINQSVQYGCFEQTMQYIKRLFNKLNSQNVQQLATSKDASNKSMIDKLIAAYQYLGTKTPTINTKREYLFKALAFKLKGADLQNYELFITQNSTFFLNIFLNLSAANRRQANASKYLLNLLFYWDRQIHDSIVDKIHTITKDQYYNQDAETNKPLLQHLLPMLSSTILEKLYKKYNSQQDFLNACGGEQALIELSYMKKLDNLPIELINFCMFDQPSYLENLLNYCETQEYNFLARCYLYAPYAFSIIYENWSSIDSSQQHRLLNTSDLTLFPDSNFLCYLLELSYQKNSEQTDGYLSMVNNLLPQQHGIQSIAFWLTTIDLPTDKVQLIYESVFLPYLIDTKTPLKVGDINEEALTYLMTFFNQKALQTFFQRKLDSLRTISLQEKNNLRDIINLVSTHDPEQPTPILYCIIHEADKTPRSSLFEPKSAQYTLNQLDYELNNRHRFNDHDEYHHSIELTDFSPHQ